MKWEAYLYYKNYNLALGNNLIDGTGSTGNKGNWTAPSQDTINSLPILGQTSRTISISLHILAHRPMCFVKPHKAKHSDLKTGVQCTRKAGGESSHVPEPNENCRTLIHSRKAIQI